MIFFESSYRRKRLWPRCWIRIIVRCSSL